MVPARVVLLCLLLGCNAQEDGGGDDTGTPSAGAAGTVSGAGGPTVAGASGAAAGGAGTGGAAGTSGAGTSGTSGSSGAGTGGSSGAGTGGAGTSGAGGTAAGSSGAGSGAIAATFDTVKLVMGGGGGIMPCAAAPCHGVGGVAPPMKPLELPPTNDPQLYMNLTTYVSEACGQRTLVVPGSPADSALLTILRGPCGMTPRMPYGCDPVVGDCIPDEYIAAVEQWIANGAAPP